MITFHSKTLLRQFYKALNEKTYPYIDSTARVDKNAKIYNPSNLIMGKQTNIDSGATIMNTRASFIMGDFSGAAIGLLVITGNHMSIIGKTHKQVSDIDKDKSNNPKQFDKDVIVEEDVWLAARVTLLYGSHIKRGAIIGAGSVVRNIIPPYAIAIGNPAKVIGFRYTPEEILEHEKQLFAEKDRLPYDLLQKNYQKYYLDRIKEINQFVKI